MTIDELEEMIKAYEAKQNFLYSKNQEVDVKLALQIRFLKVLLELRNSDAVKKIVDKQ